MVILVLAVVPVAGMLESGLRAATSPGEHDAARALTNKKLEEVRGLPYSRPGATDSTTDSATDSAVESTRHPRTP